MHPGHRPRTPQAEADLRLTEACRSHEPANPPPPPCCATHSVGGKVDGALLGPFEGLWHILHVIECKLHMVIGHEDAAGRREGSPR